MKKLTEFVKMTLIGGLLVVLPIWVTVLLLLKAINGALSVLRPIAKMLPQGVVHDDLVALALLLLICFVTGLLMRTRPVQRFAQRLERQTLERVPGYTLLRGLTRQLAGKDEEQTFQPALVELEDALVPAFIVEKHADGQFTVFVSSSPTPMAGTIYILRPERVHPVNVSLTKAMVSITKWGAGSGEWLAAMRPK
jgi:uncharacterized membrane protein